MSIIRSLIDDTPYKPNALQGVAGKALSTERREIVIFRCLEGLGDAINPLGISYLPPGFKRLGVLAAEPGLPSVAPQLLVSGKKAAQARQEPTPRADTEVDRQEWTPRNHVLSD